MPDGEFSVYRRNPESGITMGRLATGLTKLQVADWLSSQTGFNSDQLASYAVISDETDYVWNAENFLEEYPDHAVVAAWAAGAIWARDKRQKQIHTSWPALAMALDALEAQVNAIPSSVPRRRRRQLAMSELVLGVAGSFAATAPGSEDEIREKYGLSPADMQKVKIAIGSRLEAWALRLGYDEHRDVD